MLTNVMAPLIAFGLSVATIDGVGTRPDADVTDRMCVVYATPSPLSGVGDADDEPPGAHCASEQLPIGAPAPSPAAN